jgi:hypothetical protein
MAIQSGYTGLYKAPSGTGTPVSYVITNDNANYLFILMMSPMTGQYIYNIASNPLFDNIILCAPSVDALWISDIVNVILSLKDLKPTIKWFFPNTPTIKVPVPVQLTQERANIFTLEDRNDPGRHNWQPSIEFILSNHEDREFYDVIIRDETAKRYLCQYLTPDKLDTLMADPKLDELHIAYKSTIYGGINFEEAIKYNPKYKKRLKIHSFTSPEEMQYALTHYHDNFPIKVV